MEQKADAATVPTHYQLQCLQSCVEQKANAVTVPSMQQFVAMQRSMLQALCDVVSRMDKFDAVPSRGGWQQRPAEVGHAQTLDGGAAGCLAQDVPQSQAQPGGGWEGVAGLGDVGGQQAPLQADEQCPVQ